VRAEADNRFDLRAGGLSEAVRAASGVLDAGGLVVAPTETVYGVFAGAQSETALGALGGAASSDTPAPDAGEPRFTWHAPSVNAVESAVSLPTPVHRRLVRGLAPGPARFVIEQDAPALEHAHGVLGVEPGVFTSIGNGSDTDPGRRTALARVGSRSACRTTGSWPVRSLEACDRARWSRTAWAGPGSGVVRGRGRARRGSAGAGRRRGSGA
jgi:hypothetical protein